MAVEGPGKGQFKGNIPPQLLSPKDGTFAEPTTIKSALTNKKNQQQPVIDHQVPIVSRGQPSQGTYAPRNALNSHESGRESVPQGTIERPGTDKQRLQQAYTSQPGARPQSSQSGLAPQGRMAVHTQKQVPPTQGMNSRLGPMMGDPSGGAYPAVKYQQPSAYVPVEVYSDDHGLQRTDEAALEELAYDPIHPPAGYFSTLSTAELDPRNYKHVPNVWMKRIPCAGKPLNRDDQSRPLLG